MKKWWAVLLALVVLAGLWVWLSEPEPLAVRVTAVQQGTVSATVSNTRAGTVRACRRSALSMPIGGVVDRLLVDEGDAVAAGQLLLELWNRDRRAEVNRAQAALEAAQLERQRACVLAERLQREAKRLQALAERDLASEEAVDRAATDAVGQRQACEAAAAQINVARAQLELQQAVLERSQLRAPFAGVVAEINGEVGEFITPSPPGVPTPPAVDLIDYSCLYVTAPIDEIDASQLQVGLPATVTLDAFRGLEFPGEVTRIAPYVLDLEKQARTVDVDVTLQALPENVHLLVGYSADITVLLEQRDDVLRIPTEALLVGDEVWVLDQTVGQLEKRQVETGISNWTWTQITGGLNSGELVVVSPDQPGLEPGAAAVAAGD